MLPGVGIFGSDPISKVLIQILRHFDFEIHAIWTNHYEIDNKFVTSLDSAGNSNSKETITKNFPKIITTSIDNVLLNKNVNLVFVCCQPNLHSQISTKALGIGKNVVCLFPTCKNIEEIIHMINSAHYYPSLISSINYGGLRFLSEFKLFKQSMSLIGDIKVCNIVINCQNIAVIRNDNNKSLNTSTNGKLQQRHGSLSSLIDTIADVSSSNCSSSINWLSDRDLGAGVLNRFGAAMISLILNMFDKKKVTKVFGNLKTFIEDIEDDSQCSDSNNNRQVPQIKCHIRKITADDHCTFQLNLEPESILVNVTINSLAQCKYSQEIVLTGTDGSLLWKNSQVYFRSSNVNKINLVQKQQQIIKKQLNNQRTGDIDNNNNNMDDLNEDSSNSQNSNTDSSSFYYETKLLSSESVDTAAENFLNTYKNLELKHPELPLIFIKGLYYYIENIKREFLNRSSTSRANTANEPALPIENFEHTRIVQLIVKNISLSSDKNRWVTVNY